MKVRIIFINLICIALLSSCSLFHKESFEGKWDASYVRGNWTAVKK
jgi:hypothetical protein